jgi:hypothetical protein
MMEIQVLKDCDLTGTNQNGFKQKWSMSTLAMELQSMILRSLAEDINVLMSSLDLRSETLN